MDQNNKYPDDQIRRWVPVFPQGPSKKKKALENPRLLVGAEGGEPPTLCL